MSDDINDQLVLIVGYSTTGKSMSLRNIRNQERWMYLNTESGKRLPFKNKFESYRVSDPYQVVEGFDYAIANSDNYDGIIVDSLTFMMDMYETQYVVYAADTRSAWQNYQQFFKDLIQNKVVLFGKPVIFTAHVKEIYDEKTLSMKAKVPIKGALAGTGIEAYFSTIVATKKVAIEDLESMDSKLCPITDEDRELGYKHVFQTRITKETVGENIRSPMGLFEKNQLFMDNDAQLLLDHLNEYYND